MGNEAADMVNNMNKIEVWDLYDKNRNLTGQEHVRGAGPIPDNQYHLVVHVWLRNSEGKYLIAQRAAHRESNPLMWECQGGSVLKGESSLDGALREVFEEVGVRLDPQSGTLVFSHLRDVVNGVRFGDIMDVWLFTYDGAASLGDATTDEVADTKWLTVDEIKQLYNEGKFVKTLHYFFEKIAKENCQTE